MPHDIVVGAGGLIHHGDPLAGLGREGQLKALLPIAGRPMLHWVLDAISESREIQRVFLLGVDPESELRCDGKPIHYLPPQPSFVHSLTQGGIAVRQNDPLHPLALWVSADLPLIRGEMLDWFIRTARRSRHEFYFPVIDPELMRQRFPDARRTVFKLRDRSILVGDVCAGDIRSAEEVSHPLCVQFAKARKSPWKIARAVGPAALLRFLTGRATTKYCLELVQQKLGLNGTLIDCPWPEMGMDVDKPEDYELVANELQRAERGGEG